MSPLWGPCGRLARAGTGRLSTGCCSCSTGQSWSQNHPAKTTITPYSLRGREQPAVAAPRWWDEVGPDLAQLSPADVLDRLESDGDPFTQG